MNKLSIKQTLRNYTCLICLKNFIWPSDSKMERNLNYEKQQGIIAILCSLLIYYTTISDTYLHLNSVGDYILMLLLHKHYHWKFHTKNNTVYFSLVCMCFELFSAIFDWQYNYCCFFFLYVINDVTRIIITALLPGNLIVPDLPYCDSLSAFIDTELRVKCLQPALH